MAATSQPLTSQLRLSSGNGPITRTVLRTALRDALESEIPIIDVAGAFSSAIEERLAVARAVRAAAMNNGFFYVRNHGIPAAVSEAAAEACHDFFRQDAEVKDRADARHSAYFNGYRGRGTQRINAAEGVDARETLSWTYDPRYDPAVDGGVEAVPEPARRFMRPEDFLWDATAEAVPHLKARLVAYFAACLALARALTRVFALSLDLDEDFFADKVRYPDAAYAFNYYPPLPLPPAPPPQRGDQRDEDSSSTGVSIGSHTDFQLFTVLWQDDQGGLQVLDRSGQWLRARPMPGTLVVNIGDYMQRVTNGRYVSTVHRARNDGAQGRARLSMAFFWGFGLHESCGVVDSCVGDEGRLYEEIGCEEWVQRRVREMLKAGEDEKDTN
jgi:isopenicillin N synthase-like dioxygenase